MEDMQGLIEYIEKYGRYSFSDFPFNEIDALILSQLVYIDFDFVVGDKPVFLSDAAMRLFSKYSDEEIESFIGITSKAFRLLMSCAKSHRYGYSKLCYYVNYVDGAIDKQFSAINFILDRDNTAVAFRGTDITVTGVKESAMLSYMFPVPAQIEALHYFQETAMMGKGSIYICGHSKGGNLAVFAGVSCSNSLKKRIAGIYEFDAPGFPEWFFDRYDYKQIENRIYFFAPEASVFGRILKHSKRPVIVKSINEGIKQHQVSSWIINEATLQTVDAFNQSSNFASDYLNGIIEYVGEDDLELFFDTLEFVVERMGIEDFYDLKGFDFRKAFRLVDSVNELNDAQKENFKEIIKKASSGLAKEIFTGKYKSHLDSLKQEQ